MTMLAVGQAGPVAEVSGMGAAVRRPMAARDAGPVRETVADLPGLVARAARGDGGAWRELVEAYSGRVFGLLYRQCKDRDLAEELTQAAFVKVVDKLGDFEGGEKFEAWLFRIATNGLRDEMRRRKRQARPTDMGPGATAGREGESQAWASEEMRVVTGLDAPAGPSELAERAEAAERLRRAVDELPEADRTVLHLRHTAGLSFAEIAETLEQPLGTVLARAHRALGKLRKMLPDLGEG